MNEEISKRIKAHIERSAIDPNGPVMELLKPLLIVSCMEQDEITRKEIAYDIDSLYFSVDNRIIDLNVIKNIVLKDQAWNKKQ